MHGKVDMRGMRTKHLARTVIEQRGDAQALAIRRQRKDGLWVAWDATLIRKRHIDLNFHSKKRKIFPVKQVTYPVSIMNEYHIGTRTFTLVLLKVVADH